MGSKPRQIKIAGIRIRVEMSDQKSVKRKESVKLFVGNLAEGTTGKELQALFETLEVKVIEADVIPIKNFGFVHVDGKTGTEKLDDIISELNDYNLNGSLIRVQKSTSGVRRKPGMDSGDDCYRYV